MLAFKVLSYFFFLPVDWSYFSGSVSEEKNPQSKEAPAEAKSYMMWKGWLCLYYVFSCEKKASPPASRGRKVTVTEGTTDSVS